MLCKLSARFARCRHALQDVTIKGVVATKPRTKLCLNMQSLFLRLLTPCGYAIIPQVAQYHKGGVTLCVLPYDDVTQHLCNVNTIHEFITMPHVVLM